MDKRNKPTLRWEQRTLEETLSNSMCRVGLTRTREAVEVVEEATPMAGEVEEVAVIRMVMVMVIPVETVTQGATTTTEEGDVVVVVEEEMAIHTTTTKTLLLLLLRFSASGFWVRPLSFSSVSAILLDKPNLLFKTFDNCSVFVMNPFF